MAFTPQSERLCGSGAFCRADDIVKILRAAAGYPVIAQITSKRSILVEVSGQQRVARNTNRMVGAPGWNILLSKTGFTDEAGSCLSMRITVGERSAMVVLMGAASSSERARDALKIRRWLAGETSVGPAAESAHHRLAAPRKRGRMVAPKTEHATAVAIHRASPIVDLRPDAPVRAD